MGGMGRNRTNAIKARRSALPNCAARQVSQSVRRGLDPFLHETQEPHAGLQDFVHSFGDNFRSPTNLGR